MFYFKKIPKLHFNGKTTTPIGDCITDESTSSLKKIMS